MSPMAAIECRGLTKRYGELCAVDGLDMVVRPGELVGFLGANGAGKTTTIKMLAGLLKPTSGSAAICGADVVAEPMKARGAMGYLPDTPVLYDRLTGVEFVEFVADLYSVATSGRRERIGELMEIVDLAGRGNDLIQGYSRGMRQKVALAAMLIHDPRVVLLDEPTSGLDPRGAHVLRGILRDLCNRGVAVLFSTHILDVAERMCDRLMIVDHGHLLAQGTMAELRARSADESGSLEEIFLRLTNGEPDGVPAGEMVP